MNWPMVAKVLIFFVLFAIFLNIGGCIRPADGISSTGGLFNPCKDECRKNADFLETMRHFSPEEIQWVHWADANGESGWIPSYSCDKCYP